MAWMSPADERLYLRGIPVRGGDDRLIVQHDLELVDRVAQFADQWQACAILTALLVDRIDAEATTGALGRVHRDIRSANQRVGIVGMLREDGDADAHVHDDGL